MTGSNIGNFNDRRRVVGAFIIINAFALNVERAKPDNDDMEVRLAPGFAHPCEGAVREVNLHTPALE